MKFKSLLSVFIIGMIGLLIWGIFIVFEPVETVDVVIIGAGASGMTAAIEAERLGAHVVLLEKMPYVGGNTLRATAGINGVGTQRQEELGIDDTLKSFKNDTIRSGHNTNTIEMIEIIVNESSDAIKWLKGLNADLEDIGILAGHSAPRTHRPSGGQPVGSEIVRVLSEKIKNTKIDLRLENKAVEIKLDKKNQISGVVVEDKTGKIYTVHSKSVIIATGGFGGSPEVFVKYNQLLKGYKTTNSPSASGDFIKLVENLDVKLVDMNYIQTHPTVSPQYGVLITEAVRGNGGILVNNSGKRFTDEMKNRDVLSEDILGQLNKEVYLIFNEDIRKSLAATDDYIDMNIIIKSDTIADLSAKMRLDQRQLENTIDQYNTYVIDGIDLEFNRVSLNSTLNEGPYYAIQVMPAVHYCMGGILIDDKTRVINNQGVPIVGLYASGEATGGIHGQNRLGGNSLLDAVVFGRIAGRNATD